jgi:predicted SnoaL-like aldol condensation-catalyzing enzyme
MTSEERTVANSDALGANARQVMIDIFRKKDVTAVDRNFSKSLIQHDPNLADGIDGMTSFAADVASCYRPTGKPSPFSSITIRSAIFSPMTTPSTRKASAMASSE